MNIETGAALVFLGFFVCIQTSFAQYEIEEPPNWNYTLFNKNCYSPWGRTPCEDVRMCKPAVASLAIGGWPAVCGWVGEPQVVIPKVCCGLPLVLGGALMKKALEERKRQSDCGLPVWIPKLSKTTLDYYKILSSLPDVNASDPSRFNPPLENTTGSGFEISYGGRSSLPLEFPWMVSIQENGRHLCGGTLIDKTHILTAAHCFSSRRNFLGPNHFVVYAGDVNLYYGYPVNVAKIVLHEKFVPGQYFNDIAILTLEKEVHPNLRPICLPSQKLSGRSLEGAKASILEWDHRSFGGRITSELLKVINISVVPFEECQRTYRKVPRSWLYRGINEDSICADLKMRGKDVCQSDSGGPLMFKDGDYYHPNGSYIQRYVLVGINSFGVRCGRPKYPWVYTRVSSYMDWILQNMKD